MAINNRLKIPTVVLLISFFVLAGWLAGRSSVNKKSIPTNEFPLLSKRVLFNNPNEMIVNFSELRKTLKDYHKENGLDGSIYFEYLPTGTSIRVDGDSPRVGASLMKLPIAMLLYKTAEEGKINLDDQITLEESWLNSEYGDLYKKGAGYKLTLRQAAEIMLKESDNTALAAISMSLEGKAQDVDNPLTYLDLDYNQNEDSTVSISARSYSSFLKCLYFSCYLNKQDSQEILGHLANSVSENRLRSGVPSSITLAHKIGSFGDKVQSDCGIIYLNKRQYLLCVMLNGPDNSETSKHISELSKLTFDFVNNTKSSR